MFKLNVLALCTQKEESGTTLSLKRSCWILYIPILPRVLVRNYVYTGAFDFPFIISGCFVCKCLGVRGMGIGLQNQRKWGIKWELELGGELGNFSWKSPSKKDSWRLGLCAAWKTGDTAMTATMNRASPSCLWRIFNFNPRLNPTSSSF